MKVNESLRMEVVVSQREEDLAAASSASMVTSFTSQVAAMNIHL